MPLADDYPSSWRVAHPELFHPGAFSVDDHDPDCGACGDELGDNEGLECAKCYGSFHDECLPRSAVPSSAEARAAWRCPSCVLRERSTGGAALACVLCLRDADGAHEDTRLRAVKHCGVVRVVHAICAQYCSGNAELSNDAAAEPWRHPCVLFPQLDARERYVCAICRRKGATAGCQAKACQRVYHATCALDDAHAGGGRVVFAEKSYDLACRGCASMLKHPLDDPAKVKALMPPPLPQFSPTLTAVATFGDGLDADGQPLPVPRPVVAQQAAVSPPAQPAPPDKAAKVTELLKLRLVERCDCTAAAAQPVAVSIEAAVHAQYRQQKDYKNQLQRILSNFDLNVVLAARVLRGEVTPAALARMSAEDMATD